jgi:hypothetical protein
MRKQFRHPLVFGIKGLMLSPTYSQGTFQKHRRVHIKSRPKHQKQVFLYNVYEKTELLAA